MRDLEGIVAGIVDCSKIPARIKKFPALEIYRRKQLRHLLKVHILVDSLLGKEDAAVGVTDEPLGVGRGVSVEQYAGRIAARNACHKGLRPFERTARIYRHLVPNLETGLPEIQVYGLDMLGELGVSDCV